MKRAKRVVLRSRKAPSKRLVRKAISIASLCDITHTKLRGMGFSFIDGGIAVKSMDIDYPGKVCYRITVRLIPTLPDSLIYDIASWRMLVQGKLVLPMKDDAYRNSRVFCLKHIRDYCKIAFA